MRRVARRLPSGESMIVFTWRSACVVMSRRVRSSKMRAPQSNPKVALIPIPGVATTALSASTLITLSSTANATLSKMALICNTAEAEWSIFKPWWVTFRGVSKKPYRYLAHASGVNLNVIAGSKALERLHDMIALCYTFTLRRVRLVSTSFAGIDKHTCEYDCVPLAGFLTRAKREFVHSNLPGSDLQ